MGNQTLAKMQSTKSAKPGKAGRKHGRAPPRVGTLVPEDPFFWFCSQNYALHTYPANKIPKHYLGDSSCLLYRYSDFVSRTGTPDPAQQRHALTDGTTPSGHDSLRKEPSENLDLETEGLHDRRSI